MWESTSGYYLPNFSKSISFYSSSSPILSINTDVATFL
ncbi:hypothetical protein Tu3298_001666 [Staphylococcus epidermidis]